MSLSIERVDHEYNAPYRKNNGPLLFFVILGTFLVITSILANITAIDNNFEVTVPTTIPIIAYADEEYTQMEMNYIVSLDNKILYTDKFTIEMFPNSKVKLELPAKVLLKDKPTVYTLDLVSNEEIFYSTNIVR